jgi:hypothetical protein
MHREFVKDPDATFPIDHVCFDIQSWEKAVEHLGNAGGGVVILDEVGTEGSLSSRTSMSKGNRSASDLIQLMRTTKIVTIYISTDRGRIDKRVRELASVMATPTRKLNDKDTNGYGLGIALDIKYRRTSPATDAHQKHREGESSYLHHEISSLHFSPKGKIDSIIVPHPPVETWNLYEDARNEKLAEVRERAKALQEDKQTDNDDNEAMEVTKVIKATPKKEKDNSKKSFDYSSLMYC